MLLWMAHSLEYLTHLCNTGDLYQWLDIVHVICCSEEVFNFDLSIPFWNSPFLRARHYWITNYDRVISTPILKVCIRITWYMRIFYLYKFILLFLTKFKELVLDCMYLSVFHIPMLLYFFTPMFVAMRLIQRDIIICIIFDC